MIDDTRGRALAARAFRAGLAVTRADGRVVPIPIGAVPVVLDDADIARRAALAGALSSATAKAAAWRLAAGDRDAVLDALGPAERRLVLATADATPLAVTRVDFLGGAALEVNATIPAMQGYSDIAAASWLEEFAHDAPAAIAANGSNTDALLDALLDLHSRQRSGGCSVSRCCAGATMRNAPNSIIWRADSCSADSMHASSIPTSWRGTARGCGTAARRSISSIAICS